MKKMAADGDDLLTCNEPAFENCRFRPNPADLNRAERAEDVSVFRIQTPGPSPLSIIAPSGTEVAATASLLDR